MFSSAAFTAFTAFTTFTAFAATLLLVQIVATTSAESMDIVDPFPGLTLEEVKFEHGVVGSSSRHGTSSTYQPANAFLSQSTKYWHSGSDAEGKGDEAAPFPHLIWYDFQTPFIPGRVSFRPRLESGCGSEGAWCGATQYQFIGTNDRPCNQFSKWRVLCEDLSNAPFQRMTQSKYCTVKPQTKETFRCLGISVLDSSYNGGYSCVSMGAIRMWKRI